MGARRRCRGGGGVRLWGRSMLRRCEVVVVPDEEIGLFTDTTLSLKGYYANIQERSRRLGFKNL